MRLREIYTAFRYGIALLAFVPLQLTPKTVVSGCYWYFVQYLSLLSRQYNRCGYYPSKCLRDHLLMV